MRLFKPLTERDIMKKRHIKTIPERFGVDEYIKDEKDILKYNKWFNEKIREYINFIKKQDKEFDIEECLSFINVFPLGVFYLTALGTYNENDKYPNGIFKDGKWFGYCDRGDNYTFNNDDEFCKRVVLKQKAKKGDKDYMEYQKYYVIKNSVDGWSMVMTNYPKDVNYDIILTKNEVLLEGNIGVLVK